MKKYYSPTLGALSMSIALVTFTALLLAAILRSGTLPFLNGTGDLPVTANAAGQSVQDSLFRQIAASEYHIQADEKTGVMQGPNRANNLRSYFRPGLLSVENRTETGEKFRFSLATKGIQADGKQICLPQKNSRQKVEGSTLRFYHNGFTEEFVNNADGLRQTFTVNRAPAKTRNLQVTLAADGISLSESGNGVLQFNYEDEHSHDAVTFQYSDLKCWDADGKALASTMSFKGNEIQLNVSVEKAAFPVTIDPIISHGNPTNANAGIFGTASSDNLGYSVQTAGDINGDGYSDIVVGVVGYDNGLADQGAAFVYYGSASGVQTSTVTKLEGKISKALFGVAVSNAGDINGDGFGDIIVGCPQYENGEHTEGAVFIYSGTPSGINPVASDTIQSNIPKAELGRSLALAGDVNNDGFSDIIVGAPGYENGEVREGGAFLYLGSPSGLGAQPQIVESNQPFAAFGTSVAGAGDVNGDGRSDVIIGVPFYDNVQNNEGAAFVYIGNASGINAAPISILESNQNNASLGTSVASAGDYNGDGQSDVIVGAPRFDAGELDEGAAFIFTGIANGGVSSTASDTLEVDQESAEFGTSVSSAGDVNGDSYADIIVGAPFYDNGASEEGAAFVFHGTLKNITSYAAILESDQDNAQMGISVASAGDVNGDGYSDVIVGANLYSNQPLVENGAAFVFHGAPSGIQFTPTSMVGISQQDAKFGYSVSSAGDINGDGFSDIVVGAPLYDNGADATGAAFIYYGAQTGIPFAGTKIAINQANAQFGTSVSAAGDINGDGFDDVIVGAPYYDGTGTDNGAVFIYHGSSGGISIVANTTFVGDQGSAFYGTSVSGAGDVNADGIRDIIIGAPAYDFPGLNNCGAAFVHSGTNAGVSPLFTTIEGKQSSAQLGYSVATAGDVNGDGFNDVIVGAPTYSNGQAQEGAANVYYGSKNGIDPKNPDIVESDDPGALMGFSVSSTGDVNGDGISEVVVGAPLYHSKSLSTGAAFVYYGSVTGIKPLPSKIVGLQADEHFGNSVSGAGDVNGDGYSDLIVGAPDHDNGQSNEGRAFVYHGSTLGIVSFNSMSVESNVGDGRLGLSVSGAGDVNGDGYSDVITGLANFNIEFTTGGASGFIDGGAAFVYQGNLGGNILQNNLRVYNSDLVTSIGKIQLNETDFGAGLHIKSFIGRDKGRLVWETKKESIAFFSAGTLTNSTNFSGQGQYADLGGMGAELKQMVTKVGFDTKIRARAKYALAKSLTGQVYGPWRYLPIYAQSSYTIHPNPESLPVSLISFDAHVMEKTNVMLEWATATEEKSDRFDIQSSTDAKKWKTIGSQKSHENAQTRNQYSFLDTLTNADQKRYYRLKMIDLDGTFTYSSIEAVTFEGSAGTSIFPNPVSSELRFKADRKIEEVAIYSEKGNLILTVKNASGIGKVDIRHLPPGAYIVRIHGESFHMIKQ